VILSLYALLPRQLGTGFQNPQNFPSIFQKKFRARPSKRNGKFFGFELRWKRRRKQIFFVCSFFMFLAASVPSHPTLAASMEFPFYKVRYA